jgi:hypothetical protein
LCFGTLGTDMTEEAAAGTQEVVLVDSPAENSSHRSVQEGKIVLAVYLLGHLHWRL